MLILSRSNYSAIEEKVTKANKIKKEYIATIRKWTNEQIKVDSFYFVLEISCFQATNHGNLFVVTRQKVGGNYDSIAECRH